MAKIYSKALNEHLNIDRIIDKITGDHDGPTLIFVAGVHGNEPAGVFALKRSFDDFKKIKNKVKGNLYALSGNLTALEKGIRYQHQDLNRIWSIDKIKSIDANTREYTDAETCEQIAIHKTLKSILDKDKGPFYFIDLHTTSSETIPFLTVNDSMLNRKFTEKYPLPIILGIEEYLTGPLLSYINELGYVAFGFEGGQHDALSSIENHISFINLSVVFAGIVEKSAIDFNHHFELLAKHAFEKRNIFEITYRFEINPQDVFTMNPGFVNFQRIKKGQPLANHNGGSIQAKQNGRILMPQYQQQGNDGFFTIKKISPIFLNISAALRKLKADYLLTLLPGIQWSSAKHDAILVNKSIARFYTKQIFHLFGYRSSVVDRNMLLMKNRELPARTQEYNL